MAETETKSKTGTETATETKDSTFTDITDILAKLIVARPSVSLEQSLRFSLCVAPCHPWVALHDLAR